MSENEAEFILCSERRPGRWERPILLLLLLFGVILPALALGLELGAQMFSEIFFEAMPTPLHAALIGTVAFANFWCWRQRSYNLPGDDSRTGVLNGLAVATSSYYSLLFLPLLPLGVMGIVFYGLGSSSNISPGTRTPTTR